MRRFLWGISALLTIGLSLSAAANGDVSSEPDTVLQAAQDLSSELHRAIDCQRNDDAAPVCTETSRVDLESGIEVLTESIAAVIDDNDRAFLEGKLEQLRGLFHNLEVVTRDPAAHSRLPVTSSGEDSVEVGTKSDGSPSNDGCSSPQPTGLGTLTGTTADASNDGQAGCGSSIDSPDVWFLFTAPFDGVFYATTLGSSFDTVLSTHGGCPGSIANQIDCNDDSIGLDSSIRLDVGAGEEILIRLAGVAGATGEYLVNVQIDARISGRIIDDDGGAPIVGTRAKVFNKDDAWVASGESDANGDYIVTGLHQEEYFIGTAYGATNHLNELHDDIPCPLGVPYDCEPADGTPVQTILDSTITVDFELVEESTISGTVTVAPGTDPIESATVTLFDTDGERLRYVYTDAPGTYTFDMLATGTYYLTVEMRDFVNELWNDRPCPGGPNDPFTGCIPTDGDPIIVPAASAIDNIDVALTPMGSIAGVLTETGGSAPIRNAVVYATPIHTGVQGYAYPEPDGSFLIEGLEDGDHRVYVDAPLHIDELYDDLPCEPYCNPADATLVSVATGFTTGGIDIDLVRLGEISGTVTDLETSEPVDDIEIWVYDHTGQHIVSMAETGVDGTYRAAGLFDGVYFIRTDESYSWGNVLFDGIPCPFSCDPTTGTPVGVTVATITGGIDFALVHTGLIAGEVRDAQTGQPQLHYPVKLWTAGDGEVQSRTTYSTGSFLFDVPAGDYFIATAGAGDHLDELHDGFPCWGGPPGGCDPTKGTPVTVMPWYVTTVDFDLVDLLQVIFTDGFESGFTGAWSLTVP